MAVQSATVGVQVVVVEQDLGPQLVVTAQFVIVAAVHVDVLSNVVLSAVVVFDVELSEVEASEVVVSDVDELFDVDVLSDVLSDVDEPPEVEVAEFFSVLEALSVGSPSSEPCVPSGVGIPFLICIKEGNGLIPGLGGNTKLPSRGPNQRN